MTEFEEKVLKKLELFEHKFDQIDERFTQIDEHFKKIDFTLTDREVRLIRIEETMVTKDYLDERFREFGDTINNKLDFLITQILEMKQDNSIQDYRLDKLETRVDKIEKKV